MEVEIFRFRVLAKETVLVSVLWVGNLGKLVGTFIICETRNVLHTLTTKDHYLQEN